MTRLVHNVFALLPGLLLCAGSAFAQAPHQVLDYQVVAVNPNSWMVTAKEMASGQQVKFKLPISAFNGLQFDAGDIGQLKHGQKFSATGARNARMANATLQQGGGKPPKGGWKNAGAQAGGGRYTIASTHGGKKQVTARDNVTGNTYKIKVDPNAFIGYRFQANLHDLRRGRNFAIVAPNTSPLGNCCTLIAE